MSERDRERETTIVETPPAEPEGRCQICGARHEASDPILCRVCGEPVLRWGWAP